MRKTRELRITAKFWVYHNGDWVLIKLKPGRKVTFSQGGPCEEGYHYEQDTFRYDGEFVTHKWDKDAADCDGRVRDGCVRRCHVMELQSVEPFAEGEPRREKWRKVEEYYRDYAAEAAGY